MSKWLITILVLVLSASLITLYLRGQAPVSDPESSDKSLSKVMVTQELRVGSALEELPWGIIDKETGEEIGAEVEIARLVAKKLGVKLVLVNKGFDYLIPELLNRQYDVIIAGFSITDERKKLINFTDPYLTTGLVMIVKADNTTINTASDLKGKKVGVLAGTTSHDYAQTLEGIDLRVYDIPDQYTRDTKNGLIDATIYDATFAHAYVRDNPELKVTGELLQKEGYGMGLRKEDEALRLKLNEIIADMRKSEEFKSIIFNWYGLTE